MGVKSLGDSARCVRNGGNDARRPTSEDMRKTKAASAKSADADPEERTPFFFDRPFRLTAAERTLFRRRADEATASLKRNQKRDSLLGPVDLRGQTPRNACPTASARSARAWNHWGQTPRNACPTAIPPSRRARRDFSQMPPCAFSRNMRQY